MSSHGYDGAREIAKRVEYVLGLAATTGEVKEWVWRGILEKYLLNEEVLAEAEAIAEGEE